MLKSQKIDRILKLWIVSQMTGGEGTVTKPKQKQTHVTISSVRSTNSIRTNIELILKKTDSISTRKNYSEITVRRFIDRSVRKLKVLVLTSRENSLNIKEGANRAEG